MEKKRESEAEAARERRAQKRSRAEMEAEEREKGLGTELDASNKGFAMLQKMGYKKGMQFVPGVPFAWAVKVFSTLR